MKPTSLFFALAFFAQEATAFAPAVNTAATTIRQSASPASLSISSSSTSKLHMIENLDVESLSSLTTFAPTMMVSETEEWVQPLASVLGPFLNIFSFAMLCRVVISWYPSAKLNEPPYNIVAWPTEPLLRIIRGSVPPAFGVDITPIVWLAIFTFFNEILLGQQGLLTMKMKYGI